MRQKGGQKVKQNDGSLINVKEPRSKTKTSWRKSNKNNKNSYQKWLKNKNKKY